MTEFYAWARLAYWGWTQGDDNAPPFDDLDTETKAKWQRAVMAVRQADIGACGAGRLCKARA
jgi:hypothetical protein